MAAETVQPGIVLHDAGKANISLSGVHSGELCADMADSDNVCNTGTGLTVLGHDTCTGTDGKPYLCTRYGYRYDYADAAPGTQIECMATRARNMLRLTGVAALGAPRAAMDLATAFPRLGCWP